MSRNSIGRSFKRLSVRLSRSFSVGRTSLEDSKFYTENPATDEEKDMYAAIFFNMEPNRKKDLPPTLLRVCIVGIEGDILLNMPIKRRKVNDQDDGTAGATSLENVREAVLERIENRILVGYEMNVGFDALGIEHKEELCCDIAEYEPYTVKKNKPYDLKSLVKKYRYKEIENLRVPPGNLTPAESAKAIMGLFFKHRHTWEKAVGALRSYNGVPEEES